MVPGDDRLQPAVFLGDLVVHEPVRQRQVARDLLHPVQLEITRRQMLEVGVQFVLAKSARQALGNFLLEQFAFALLRDPEGRGPGQELHRLAVEHQEERVLEAVPKLVARPQRVGEGVQRQHPQIFRRLDLRGELGDDLSVLQIAPLGSGRHDQMVLDQEPQGMRGRAVQFQAPRHLGREPPAHLAVFAGVLGLARVVQEKGQIKQEGALHVVEHFRIMAEGWLVGLPDLVEFPEADEGVLVGRVLMIELMLHEAGEPAELRQVFAEKADLVHGAQHRGHVAARVENLQKSRAHMLVAQETAVHQRQIVADDLGQVGMQLQPPLLGVEKNAHQPAGLLPEDARRGGVNLALHKLEAIHDLLLLGEPIAEKTAEIRQPLRRGQQGQPPLHGAGDQIDVAGVLVEFPHELLQALARGAVGVAEVVGHGGLHAFGEDIHGPFRVVMQFVAGAQEKVIGGFELTALGGADQFARLQLRRGAGAVFEKSHPVQVLKIAQAAAAVLDVRLLHGRGVAILGMTRRLVLHAQVDVFRLVPGHALVEDLLLENLEQLRVARDQPRLDERGLGLHVAVRDLDAIRDAAHRLPHLQPDVPQWIEQSIDDGAQGGVGPSVRDQITRVEEHEVDVAVGIQLPPPIAAGGDQGDGGQVLLRQFRRGPAHAFEDVAQEQIQNGRARLADFAPAAAGAVHDLQALRLDLEKTAVPGQFLGGLATRRQRETLGGIGFDSFQKTGHGGTLASPRFKVQSSKFSAVVQFASANDGGAPGIAGLGKVPSDPAGNARRSRLYHEQVFTFHTPDRP